MRKITAWIVLLIFHGVTIGPLTAQQAGSEAEEPNRGIRRVREEALERSPDATFIDSKTFDRKLREMLKAAPKSIVVDFAENPSPNELPERLDAWLDAVEKHGGTVEIKAIERTRGFLSDALVYLARVAIQAARRSSRYRVVRNYDATIYYSPSSGLVERVVFSHSVGLRQDRSKEAGDETSWLILPEEAPELVLSEEEWRRIGSGTRGPSLGPRVSVLEPRVEDRVQGPTIEASSPLSLHIQFNENRSPVDMTSLKVTARRKSFPPISVNLTDRIRGYIEGWKIAVTAIKIPKGKYLIELVIADAEGHETVETFRLQVSVRP